MYCAAGRAVMAHASFRAIKAKGRLPTQEPGIKNRGAVSMFSGWTIWGSNVPNLFACFYPVGGITLWP